MTLIEWREEYSTGISGVDHEHQELINLINTAYEMLGDTADKTSIISCLGDIYGSISSHFALEERWMEQHNYEDYEAHRADHERLLDEIGEITDEVETSTEFDTERLRERLNNWFLAHFQTHDIRLHNTEESHSADD
ncbi:MAG: bacteriohemerythrin [Gammaproteobacteria bacterium]|jgi:hemerythrin|nr:bacteriohemerythrin [Gammaproteobacteria bacterium]